MRISPVRSKIVKLASKKSLRLLVPIVAALVIVFSFVLTQELSPSKNDVVNTEVTQTHQEQLLSQVETETGVPRSGHDPGSQQQTSLASAASNPTGAGQRVDTPAAGVNGSSSPKSSSPTSNSQTTGLNSAGCYYDYGDGSQCVPAHAATNGVLTCDGVRTHGGFPKGVKVNSDRFNLDTNNDGTACGPGE